MNVIRQVYPPNKDINFLLLQTVVYNTLRIRLVFLMLFACNLPVIFTGDLLRF